MGLQARLTPVAGMGRNLSLALGVSASAFPQPRPETRAEETLRRLLADTAGGCRAQQRMTST